MLGWTLRLLPWFMYANSEGSDETARRRRLAWAFAGRLCDTCKVHSLMSICCVQLVGSGEMKWSDMVTMKHYSLHWCKTCAMTKRDQRRSKRFITLIVIEYIINMETILHFNAFHVHVKLKRKLIRHLKELMICTLYRFHRKEHENKNVKILNTEYSDIVKWLITCIRECVTKKWFYNTYKFNYSHNFVNCRLHVTIWLRVPLIEQEKGQK